MNKQKVARSLFFLLGGMILILNLSCCGSPQTATVIHPTESKTESSPLSSSQPKVTPTQTPDLSRPDTVRPTFAAEATRLSSLPTPTSIPIGTPISDSAIDRPLTKEGPWFLYRVNENPGGWYLINADGTGRMKINNPSGDGGGKLIPFHNSDYIAFRQSSSDPMINKIYILHLPDMELVETIDLISYPGLLESDAYNDPYTGTRLALYEEPVWSPDGRYLAFMGAIEGLSSNVYIYDTVEDNVQRLTSGDHHAVDLVWSPDSLWIVHSEVEGFGQGCNDIATWAVSANGKVTLRLYDPSCDKILAWLDSAVFMSSNHRMEGEGDLRYVDLDRGQVTHLFEGRYHSHFPFDPIRGITILDPVSEDPGTPYYPPGIYVISPEYPTLELLTRDFKYFRWDSTLERIVTEDVPCDDGFIAALRADSVYECIENITPPITLLWSPNGEWGVVEESKNELFDQNSNLIRKIVDLKAEEIIWRPNSSGLFLISSDQLLYFEIPDGNLLMIDDRSPSELSWIGVN